MRAEAKKSTGAQNLMTYLAVTSVSLYSNFIRMFFLSPYIEIQFQNSSDNGFACNGGFCSQCASNDEGGRHASVCDDYGATV